MRHWKFSGDAPLNHALVKAYIQEAIDNQKKGLQFKFKKQTKKLERIPVELKLAFETHSTLERAFASLSQSKKREYIEYIINAKQEKTKRSRIDKIIPLILEGKGLHDHNN